MKVKLRRPWFVKGHKLFEPDKFGVEIPDSLADLLPRDAEVLEPPRSQAAQPVAAKAAKAPPVKPSPEEPKTLSALAKKNAENDEEAWKKAKA